MPDSILYLIVFALGCAVGYGVREYILVSDTAAPASTPDIKKSHQ